MAEKKKLYVSDNAQLMAEWDWERNTDVSPSQLTLGSHKKVWWKCNKGHEWQATINSRNNGQGCHIVQVDMPLKAKMICKQSIQL